MSENSAKTIDFMPYRVYNRDTIKKRETPERKERKKMKHYVVRLRNYEGSIVDGELYYNVENKEQAKAKYLERCKKHDIKIGKYDYITVDIIDI